MLSLFCPNEFVRSIFDIDLDHLQARKTKGIIIDVDNTLLAWGQHDVPENVIQWMQNVKEKGFLVCIASNGMAARIGDIARSLSIPAIAKAIKPRKKPFRQALNTLQLSPGEVAVIGDQMFTDVLGGNRLGLYTILVNPVSSRELASTRIVRRLERFVLRNLNKKQLVSDRALKLRAEKMHANPSKKESNR